MSCSLNRLVLFHGLRREIVYSNGSDLSSKVTLQYAAVNLLHNTTFAHYLED